MISPRCHSDQSRYAGSGLCLTHLSRDVASGSRCLQCTATAQLTFRTPSPWAGHGPQLSVSSRPAVLCQSGHSSLLAPLSANTSASDVVRRHLGHCLFSLPLSRPSGDDVNRSSCSFPIASWCRGILQSFGFSDYRFGKWFRVASQRGIYRSFMVLTRQKKISRPSASSNLRTRPNVISIELRHARRVWGERALGRGG